MTDFNFPDMPAEMRLLLACLSFAPPWSDEVKIATQQFKTADWDAFLKAVDFHRAAPLAYRNLNRRGWNGIPDRIRTELKKRVRNDAMNALALATELARLMKLFKREGIAVLPFKGPVLALQYYGDLGMRQAGDLDLLVSLEDMERSEKLLARRGYKRLKAGLVRSRIIKAGYMRLRNQFEYYSEVDGISIELHWRFFGNPYLFPLTIEQAMRRRQKIPFAGAHIETLSFEDTFCFQCVHGAMHSWESLFWLCDIAAFLHNDNVIDQERLLMYATELGVQRPVAEACLLAHKLLGSPLPVPVRDYVDRDKNVHRLVKMALHIMMSAAEPSAHPFWHEHVRKRRRTMKLRKNPGYKSFAGLFMLFHYFWRVYRYFRNG